ncbi:MAG: hypothetical protein FJX77_10900 [Armatimonadetes bacterium]|nr:hypothetical protein [Armatimonadota bacterium]
MTSFRAALAIGYGLLFILLTAVAVRHVELVSGQYLSTGVPPLPAFAGLLLLAVLRPLLLRAAPRWAPTRAEILLAYTTMCVGVVLCGLYHVRALLPEMVAVQFWGREGGPLGPLSQYLPDWLAPKDPDVVRRYYVGSPDGQVPWRFWILPLLCWSAFVVSLFTVLLASMALRRKQWLRNERLSFPLLTLPQSLTADDWSSMGAAQSRRALFLVGFGIALTFNALNILHSLFPAFPAPGFSQPLIPGPVDRPWTALKPVRMYCTLDTIGLGYFVPLEVTFSVWFFYLINRSVAIWGLANGYEWPGYPFPQEQAAGGYIAMGLILLWGLRRPVWESLQRTLGLDRRGGRDREETWAWVGLAAGTSGVLAFCHFAGLSLKLAIPFFLVLGLFVLTYARIRGETGMPFQYVFPHGQPKELLLNFLSLPKALELGGARSLVMLSSLNWLSRFHHAEEMAAYQLDSLKLSEEARIPRRTLVVGLILGLLTGLAAAYWAHLGAYYSIGSNLIASSGGFGEYRERMARVDYQQTAAFIGQPPFPNMGKQAGFLAGFCAAAVLAGLRRIWIGCPFHPLGYLMANSYGDGSTMWFPMLIAWGAKFGILRIGGLRLYRRGIPLFLGLTIGHLFIGGIFWPLFALCLSREAANAYHLLFGE